MNHQITLIIVFFSIHTAQGMQNITDANRSEHMVIVKQATEIIGGGIDLNTATKWKNVLKNAEAFQQANPNFPYRRLSRKAGQGYDAHSIANAAPVIIDFLQNKPVESEKLRKLRYTVGDHYIVKMVGIDVRALAQWNRILKNAKESNPSLPCNEAQTRASAKIAAERTLDFIEEKSTIEKEKLVRLRDILGDQHTLQVIDATN